MRFSLRFGWKRRGVLAVTWVPIPPFFLALPLRRMLVPRVGTAPVISQSRDMGMLSVGRWGRLFDEQDVAGALDLRRQLAVHLGGHSGDAAREDAAFFGQEFPEQLDVFEVDGFEVDVDASLRQGAERAAAGPPGFGGGGHRLVFLFF